jgi:hypothetical protein
MKQGDIYKSEGGYRIAWCMWGDGPVIDGSPWYATYDEAEQAKKKRLADNDRQSAIDEAIKNGDLAALEKLAPKTAEAIRKSGVI